RACTQITRAGTVAHGHLYRERHRQGGLRVNAGPAVVDGNVTIARNRAVAQFVSHWCTILVSVAARLLMHPRCRQVTALLVSDACDVRNEFCGAWRCPGTR